MSNDRAPIDLLVRRLGEKNPCVRVETLWALMKRAEAASAISAVVALLDDDEVCIESSPPSFDGDWHESFYYPSRAAVYAVGRLAPTVAVDRVAQALARLHGKIHHIDHHPALGPREHRISWTRDDIAPFDSTLDAALESLVREGPEDLRAAAAAVMQATGRTRRPPDSHHE